VSRFSALEKLHPPDWEALVADLRREGTPKRVHHMELFHDDEIASAIIERYDLLSGAEANDPDLVRKKQLALRRFLGFDYVSASMPDREMPLNYLRADDTAPLRRTRGRDFMDEHRGPITSWEEFEKYPWPDPDAPRATREIEWFQENAPDDMCIACHTGHFAEYLTWLMGYETLCYALYDRRDLVRALADRILEFHTAELRRILEFDRVRIVWGSDDMGFKTGLLISPDDMREFVLPGHKRLARMVHEAGRLYLLHSCGNLRDIIDELIDDVKIDGKHSFEDTIEDVRDAKRTYGRRTALIGGIDVDFLCRSSEPAIRRRVRETLDICMPHGGYCLGTGNSVANYIPLDHYLAMVDEGWRYGT